MAVSIYANRGMTLEAMIDQANEVYRRRGVAVVHKRPTPVKIERVLKGGKVQGYLEKPSTVDYEGVYRGRALVFEAKSTRERNRFPLANIHEHQMVHMRQCLDQGAIVFAVVEFSKHDVRFYVPAKMLLEAWDRTVSGGPKSIPFEAMNESCFAIPAGRGVLVDYLSVVDRILARKEGAS